MNVPWHKNFIGKAMIENKKHWSKIQLLRNHIKNPNIIIKGKHSYYSDCWDKGFEESVVRYLHGDEGSQNYQPNWPIDKLYIGNYLCIAAEAIILMGGNHTHRSDWFSLYPFMDYIKEAYQSKGDTILGDGSWIGMRAIIMPGINIGEGAIIGANSVVTKDVAAYSVIAGNPAKQVKLRFPKDIIKRLLSLKIYDWDESKFESLKTHLCSNNIIALEQANYNYDKNL